MILDLSQTTTIVAGKQKKTVGTARTSFLRFSLSPHRLDKLRPPSCSPHREEAKNTEFTHLRGRNRKSPTELPDFLLFESPSSCVDLLNQEHRRALRVKAKPLPTIVRRETAGGRTEVGRAHGGENGSREFWEFPTDPC